MGEHRCSVKETSKAIYKFVLQSAVSGRRISNCPGSGDSSKRWLIRYQWRCFFWTVLGILELEKMSGTATEIPGIFWVPNAYVSNLLWRNWAEMMWGSLGSVLCIYPSQGGAAWQIFPSCLSVPYTAFSNSRTLHVTTGTGMTGMTDDCVNQSPVTLQ